MSKSLTEYLGHARASDRVGHGHKKRHQLTRDIKRLRAKIEAADPDRCARLVLALDKSRRELAAMGTPPIDTFIDPRDRRFHN